MHDERASLLRAIIQNPADDAAKLVYADWLEEYGDEEDRGAGMHREVNVFSAAGTPFMSRGCDGSSSTFSTDSLSPIAS